MRIIARTDENQREIVAEFRKRGFSVLLLHQLGDGRPDIVIGKYGKNWLVEIKNGRKPPSKRKLTKDQKDFHAEWKGKIFIIESLNDVADLDIKLLAEEKWDTNA